MKLQGIDLLMDLVTRSQYIVALTGAGISTSAGIPDFRGPDGIYNRKDIPADKLFDIKVFREDPGLFYTHIGEIFDIAVDAEPTLGHKFLKKLEELGKLKCVVTQNIDSLHTKAGNSHVIAVHGNFDTFTDMETGEKEDINEKIIKSIKSGKVVTNKQKHVLKPDVVFFGEPVLGLEKALTEVQKADLLICLGTSLSVYPVSTLPSYLGDDAKLMIINNTVTDYDGRAQLVLHDDIDQVVKKSGLY